MSLTTLLIHHRFKNLNPNRTSSSQTIILSLQSSKTYFLVVLPTKQIVNTKIRLIILIIFFAAKDGEALYSQQKQDLELTVAQSMNSLLPNSDLN